MYEGKTDSERQTGPLAEAGELLQGIAALLWPILAFAVLAAFYKQLRVLIGRIKSGKAGDWEFTLDQPPGTLASEAVADQLESALASPAFQLQLRAVLEREKGDTDPSTASKEVTQLVRAAAESSVSKAFIKLDSRPLLGRSRGRVFEEPYSPDRTVNDLLTSIWSQMRPHVAPFAYRDGWVLRRSGTRETLRDMGQRWAEDHGRKRDDRKLSEVGITPDGDYEVVRGPNPEAALGGWQWDR